MRVALLAVAALALVGFLWVAVIVPQKNDAEEKGAAQELLAGADPAKQKVSAKAAESGRLNGAGRDVKVEAKVDGRYGPMQWIVADDGNIRAWNRNNALEIALTPTLTGGKVMWSCRGYPARAMPLT